MMGLLGAKSGLVYDLAVYDYLVLPHKNAIMFVASATVSRARSDDEAMLGIVKEERQRRRPVPPPTGG